MRTAILLVIPRTSPAQILIGPEVPIDRQIAAFKQIAADRENADFAELQLWVSDAGIAKRMKFRLPKPAPAPSDDAEALALAAQSAGASADPVAAADAAREQSEEQASAQRTADTTAAQAAAKKPKTKK